MMKRRLSVVVLVLLLIFTFCFAASCTSGNGNDNIGGSASGRQDSQAAESSDDDSGDDIASDLIVDVDLTTLSSTMVYAEVYNMLVNPDDYMGKTIKMRGAYYASYFDETKQYYHYVVIEDSAACCAQGLEFKWNGNNTYPDDYPEDQTIIEVVGVFGRYSELDRSYTYISTDLITQVKQ